MMLRLLFGVWVVLLMATNPVAAEPKKIIPLPGIPANFRVTYGCGSTHAQWGGDEYRLSADGKLIHIDGSRSGGQKYHHYQLTGADLKRLIKAIETHDFFHVAEKNVGRSRAQGDPFASPEEVHDGVSKYLSVRLGQRAHTVRALNISVAPMDAIVETLMQLADEKKRLRTWQDPAHLLVELSAGVFVGPDRRS